MKIDLQNRLKSTIHFHEKDKFLSHLKTTFFVRYKYSGTLSKDEIKIWKLSHWFGSFYPVIYGRVNEVDGKLKLTLKTKLNSFGVLLCVLIMGVWTYSSIAGILIQETNEWTFLWKRLIVCFVLISIPLICFKLAYRYEKKHALSELQELFKK